MGVFYGNFNPDATFTSDIGSITRLATSAPFGRYLQEEIFQQSAFYTSGILAADARLNGVQVVSSEHCAAGGHRPILGGCLGLLAGIVPALVQAPGVRAVDTLLDVVEGCEERKLNTGTNGVIQAAVSCQNAGGVESGLLEDFFLQVATERCASSETGDRPDVAGEGCVGVEVPVKNAHGSPGWKGLLFGAVHSGFSLELTRQFRILGLQPNHFGEVSRGIGVVHPIG